MTPNRTDAKNLIRKYFDDVLHMKYRMIYNSSLLFIKKVKFILFGYTAYAYIAIDFQRRNDEIKTLASNEGKNKKLTDEEIQEETKTLGTFILISSLDLTIDEILPYYSSRNYVEQVFDVSKTNAMLLPLRCHSKETLMGHILINFLTVISYLAIEKQISNNKYTATKVLFEFSLLFGKIINNNIYIYEPTKTIKLLAKSINVNIPSILDI
jgi:transposase